MSSGIRRRSTGVLWKGMGRGLLAILGLAAIAAGAPDPNSISDPLFPSEWGLHNTGQIFPVGCSPFPSSTCRQGTPDADLDWLEARTAGATGAGVVIAIGTPNPGATVNCLNPDLAAQLWVNPGETPGNGIDDDGNGFVDDVNGANFGSNNGAVCLSGPGPSQDHDSDVSIVALAAQDGLGAVGVAPAAKLMIVSDWLAHGDQDLYTRVIPYLEAAGVRVLMVPYTGIALSGVGSPQAQCSNRAKQGPLDRAQILANSSVLVVWGFPGEYPGCDPSAVALQSSTSSDTTNDPPSPFMSFAAPAERGWATSVALSWAIPTAAGVAALALEINPSLSRAQLMQRMMDGADKVGSVPYDPNGWNDTYGSGRLNAYTTLLLGDLDGDGIDGDGDGSGVLGDGACLPGATSGCDDSCPADANPTQADAELDGVGDVCDNCAATVNPAQLDGGGILGTQPDGIGDACQCGDASGNGVLDAGDRSQAMLCIQGLGTCRPTCDANNDSLCDSSDLVALAATLSGGPLPTCSIP